MRSRELAALVAFFAAGACVPSVSAHQSSYRRLTSKALLVTHGVVRFNRNSVGHIVTPALRAVATTGSGDAAMLEFTYLGLPSEAQALASGEVRRQIGLKLRAQDSCNVVYVMLVLDVEPRLVVSVKRNPGQSRHEQCRDQGYVRVEPRAASPALSAIHERKTHQLRAAIDAHGDLAVELDRRTVWLGPLPETIAELDGPIGMRADNVRASFSLMLPTP